MNHIGFLIFRAHKKLRHLLTILILIKPNSEQIIDKAQDFVVTGKIYYLRR
jgi:hypothetical protein